MTPKEKAAHLAKTKTALPKPSRPSDRAKLFNRLNHVPDYTLEQMRAMLRPDRPARKFRFPTS